MLKTRCSSLSDNGINSEIPLILLDFFYIYSTGGSLWKYCTCGCGNPHPFASSQQFDSYKSTSNMTKKCKNREKATKPSTYADYKKPTFRKTRRTRALYNKIIKLMLYTEDK